MAEFSARTSSHQQFKATHLGVLFAQPRLPERWSRAISSRSNDFAREVIITQLVPFSRRTEWQEKGSSTVAASTTDIEWLEKAYSFREHKEVLRFLTTYPFLTSVLSEAYYRIASYFPSSPLTLKVYHDREDAFSDDQLVVTIRTAFDPDEAVNILRNLDENWWLDAMDYAEGKMIIDLEFR